MGEWPGTCPGEPELGLMSLQRCGQLRLPLPALSGPQGVHAPAAAGRVCLRQKNTRATAMDAVLMLVLLPLLGHESCPDLPAAADPAMARRLALSSSVKAAPRGGGSDPPKAGRSLRTPSCVGLELSLELEP